MRAVLDTNTVVSASLFPSGRLSWIRDCWQSGRILPLASTATVEELVRVLAYPKFRLDEGEIAVLLAAYLPHAEVVPLSSRWPKGLRRCADPDDDKFLALAAHGNAQVLVSGDRALLDLGEGSSFAIETPARFRLRFEEI